MNAAASNRRLPVGEVLSAGGRLFVGGLPGIFPWILAAEIIGALPIAGAGGGLLSADLSRLAQPAYVVWLLFAICAQTFLYGMAILKLAQRDGTPVVSPMRQAIRSIPALFIAYLIYELLVVFGVGFAFILMLLFALLLGVLPGVLVAIIPLAPTAWISTALAFFAYPAVLERRGPFDSLGRSLQLAKSNWVRAAGVVSVPAIALLVVALLQDVMPAINMWHQTTQLLSQVSSQASVANLQSLMTHLDANQKAVSYPWWQAFTVLLSALAWWYAVAVCYVEYRNLSGAAAVTER